MLPIDRTALIAAQTNQVPGLLIQSAKNIAAIQVPYDTIDELNAKVDANHAAGTTGTTQLADGSVTTAKQADLSVTNPKLAPSSVTLDKMADNSVGTTELVDLSVTNAKIADGVITTAKFVAGALNNDTQNALNIVALQAETASRGINVKYPPSPLVAAKGDGTDDTAAFNAIISYAIANNKNPIIIPSGKYRVNLVINNNSLSFVGAGIVDDFGTPNGTVLSPFDKTKPCIQLGNGSQLVDYISFSGMSLIGDGAAYTTSDGLRVYGAYNCFYNNFHVYNFGRNNIAFETNGTYHSYKQYFNNVVSSEAYGSCIYINDNYGGITFTNFNFIPRIAAGAYVVNINGDGAMLHLANGYIDWYDGHCINTTGKPTIFCANVVWDLSGVSPAIMIVSDQNVASQYVCLNGLYTIDTGKIQYTDGSIEFNYNFMNVPWIESPIVSHMMTFKDKIGAAATQASTIIQSSNGDLEVTSATGAVIKGNTGYQPFTVFNMTNGLASGIRLYSYDNTGVGRWARFHYSSQLNRAYFASSNNASLDVGGGYQAPLILNNNFLWVDATGRIRIKSATPGYDTDGSVINAGLSGITSARPSTDLYVGMPYFDTSLGKPIWYKTGTTWIDATGATV
jgi:hypothetical protein